MHLGFGKTSLVALIASAAIAATHPHGSVPLVESQQQAIAKNDPSLSRRTQKVLEVHCEHGCGYVEDNWTNTLWHDPTALFTALLFLSTAALWLVTERTLRHAKTSSEQQLRAYVGVVDIVLESARVDDPTYIIPQPFPAGYISADLLRVRIKNFGQTPASQVTVLMNWQTTSFGFNAPAGTQFPNYITAEIIDGAARYMLDREREVELLIPLTDISYFREARAKKLTLYFYGQLEYRDIHGKKWHRVFRYIWEPWSAPGDRLVPAIDGNNEKQIS